MITFNTMNLYCTALRVLSRAMKDYHIQFPRPHSFRAYYEHPMLDMDMENRSITIKVSLIAHDDAPAPAIKQDLDTLISAFTTGTLMPSQLAPFVADRNSLEVKIKDLDEMCQKAKDELDDNYCDCDGFMVLYTHSIVFTIPNDEAEKALYENIKHLM